MFITGVNATSDKLFTGVVYTADKFIYIYIFINSRGLGFFYKFFLLVIYDKKKTQLVATIVEAAVPAFC
jgi:hypothetical protein